MEGDLITVGRIPYFSVEPVLPRTNIVPSYYYLPYDNDHQFEIARAALQELVEQNRLQTTNIQSASLHAIQSDVKGDHNIFRFGGVGITEEQQASAFGSIASAVFRIVMLHAVQISENFWPTFEPNVVMERNRPALTFQVKEGDPAFKLLDANDGVNDNRETAERYWTEYDSLFPPALIESDVLQHRECRVPFQGMMIIFRNNFREVITILTMGEATMHPRGEGWNSDEFDSKVKVKCTRQTIKYGSSEKDRKYFRKLQENCVPVERMTAFERNRDDVWQQLDEDMKKYSKDKIEKEKKKEDQACSQVKVQTLEAR